MDFENQRKNDEKTFLFKKNRNITISFFLKKIILSCWNICGKMLKKQNRNGKEKKMKGKKKDLKLVNYFYVLL